MGGWGFGSSRSVPPGASLRDEDVSFWRGRRNVEVRQAIESQMEKRKSSRLGEEWGHGNEGERALQAGIHGAESLEGVRVADEGNDALERTQELESEGDMEVMELQSLSQEEKRQVLGIDTRSIVHKLEVLPSISAAQEKWSEALRHQHLPAHHVKAEGTTMTSQNEPAHSGIPERQSGSCVDQPQERDSSREKFIWKEPFVHPTVPEASTSPLDEKHQDQNSWRHPEYQHQKETASREKSIWVGSIVHPIDRESSPGLHTNQQQEEASSGEKSNSSGSVVHSIDQEPPIKPSVDTSIWVGSLVHPVQRESPSQQSVRGALEQWSDALHGRNETPSSSMSVVDKKNSIWVGSVVHPIEEASPSSTLDQALSKWSEANRNEGGSQIVQRGQTSQKSSIWVGSTIRRIEQPETDENYIPLDNALEKWSDAVGGAARVSNREDHPEDPSIWVGSVVRPIQDTHYSGEHVLDGALQKWSSALHSEEKKNVSIREGIRQEKQSSIWVGSVARPARDIEDRKPSRDLDQALGRWSDALRREGSGKDLLQGQSREMETAVLGLEDNAIDGNASGPLPISKTSSKEWRFSGNIPSEEGSKKSLVRQGSSRGEGETSTPPPMMIPQDLKPKDLWHSIPVQKKSLEPTTRSPPPTSKPSMNRSVDRSVPTKPVRRSGGFSCFGCT